MQRTNRRLTGRHACHLQVAYRSGPEWRPATAMDVSHNGCRLRLGEDLQRATAVSVRFAQATSAGQPLAASVDGTVIWSRLEGLSHQAGIHFPAESAELAAIITALY